MASKALGDLTGLLSQFCLLPLLPQVLCISHTGFFFFSCFLNTSSSGLLFKTTSCGFQLIALPQYLLTISPSSSAFRGFSNLRQLLPNHLLSHHSHYFFFLHGKLSCSLIKNKNKNIHFSSYWKLQNRTFWVLFTAGYPGS